MHLEFDTKTTNYRNSIQHLGKDNTAMQVAAAIEKKLSEAFSPVRILVLDESYKHKGHAGARPEGETHFRVEIVSADFDGLSRVDRQRKVYAALAEEMGQDIHALALKSLTPDEDSVR